jgi:hypothetical protein
MHTLRRALVIALFTVCSFTGTFSQEQKTASVAGRVTVDGKPAAGVPVVLNPTASSEAAQLRQILSGGSSFKTTTDQEGNYRIEAPPGRYRVSPSSSALIVSESESKGDERQIALAEGQGVEGVNFTLIRGGVITGRVTDAQGRPLVREIIGIIGADDSASTPPRFSSESLLSSGSMYFTDDRGVYRIYGLPAGRYLVSAGAGENMPDVSAIFGMRSRPRTYHPGVIDRTKAKAVDVTAGGEVTGIDIRIVPGARGIQATGRVIDADTGKPLQNAIVMCMPAREGSLPGGVAGGFSPSDAKGEFQIKNLSPGRYTAVAQFVEQESEFYGETASFEIKSEDVTGIELKMRRGGSISGVATVEDTDDLEAIAGISQLLLSASVSPSGAQEADANLGIDRFGTGRGKIQPDGSFRILGLRPGKVHIHINSLLSSKKLRLVRVERDGIDQTAGIDLRAGESITGVRLVLSAAESGIRGQVVVTGGSLPSGTSLVVYAERESEDEDDDSEGFSTVDASGRFIIENLSPGTYRLTMTATDSKGERVQMPDVTQTVTVVKGAQAEAVLTINLKR